MRSFIIIACLFSVCFAASGQNQPLLRDHSVVKEINLPSGPLKNEKNSYGNRADPYRYIISENDIYNLFGYDTMMRYHNFNFTVYHILGEKKCRQCMKYCHHEEGIEACHRNLCIREWVWTMRKNDRAFTTVTATAPATGILPGEEAKDVPAFRDTVMQPVSIADSGMAKWHTTGHGDCHGWFTYGVFKDNFHPVLLLKEWSHYGGCRAAGSRSAVIKFQTVTGVLHYKKNTILVQRN